MTDQPDQPINADNSGIPVGASQTTSGTPANSSSGGSIILEPRPIEGRFSALSVRVPKEIEACTGIVVNGHRIKSFAYSTDVAIIHNTNADAILAVYPFTGHPKITQAICTVAKAPVFVGVGGGTTQGVRSAELAMFSEMQGVAGVVVNAPAPNETIEAICAMVDIPVMATIVKFDEHTHEKIAAGARIINVAAGRNTANVVAEVRAAYPDLPIVATGGPTAKSINATIAAGANAISWTPPDAQFLQGVMMDDYRAGGMGHAAEVNVEEASSSSAAANATATNAADKTDKTGSATSSGSTVQVADPNDEAPEIADISDAPHVSGSTRTAFVPGGSTLSERISAVVEGVLAANERAAAAASTGDQAAQDAGNGASPAQSKANATSSKAEAIEDAIEADGSIFEDECAAEKIVDDAAAAAGQADRDLVVEKIEEAREIVADEIEGAREAVKRAFRAHQEARATIAGDIRDAHDAARRIIRSANEQAAAQQTANPDDKTAE